MGTVHSLLRAQSSPERLRERFDHVFPDFGPVKDGRTQPLPPILVSGGIFFFPFQAAGQVADEMLRDATLFGLSCCRQQLRFYCLIP